MMENYETSKSNPSSSQSHFLKLDQKPFIKIPALTRAYIEFYINSSIKKSKNNSFISSNLIELSLNFFTDFQTYSLPVSFKVLNGSIKLIDRFSTELSKIKLKTFPYQIFTHSIDLKSTFAEILNIETLEFRYYGNLFNFKWKELNESFEDGEISYGRSYALILPNKTTTIGHLEFDPKLLCQENMYLGIEPNEDYSIKKLSNAMITGPDQLKNASMSLVHYIWLKTFKINNLNFLSSEKILQAVDFDVKMLSIMENNFKNLNKLNEEFKSSLEIKIGKKNLPNLNLSIYYPIEFNFERPRIAWPYSVSFDMTQIHLESTTRNITLFNPSKSSVLMQILLLDSYSTKQQFLDLINSNKFLTRNKNFSNHSKKIFSISIFHKQLANYQRINKILHDLDIQPDKQSIVTILEPGETAHLKIKFSPTRLGSFENFLIIRNNFTLMEICHLTGEAGTAEIRVNGQAPTHTSNFLNKEFLHKTVDQSFLNIKMSRKKEICESMKQDQADNHKGIMNLNTSFGSLFEYLNVLDESSGSCAKQSDTACQAPKLDDTTRKWYKNREGIVLRNLFQIKNIGSTDLLVFKILLDGEPCISQGFEIHNCHPFKLSPNLDTVFHLDVRYQPDFTSSIILKRLTLVTNIGDMEYNVRVTIPYNMLSLCHDSLPRPPLESYLIYLCLTLLTFLLTIIFISAIFESKSIVNFQIVNLKKSICQKKEFVALQVASEFNFQKDGSVPGKHSAPTITRAKSMNEAEPKQIKSPRSVRKHLASPKTNETKPKAKKPHKEKQNDNFGFEPLEINIKTPNSPKVHKKEEKKPNENAAAELPSNFDLTETKSKKEKKKSKRQDKSENEKLGSFKAISSGSSGSISANSSGTSTPSPSISMSPVQFSDTKPKSSTQIENNRQEFKNNKAEVKKINKQILIQNTIDDTLNNLKKNSQKEQISNNSDDKIETFKQNLTMLNLLNILNYQQEPVVDMPSSACEQNGLLFSQLKHLYQSNQLAHTNSMLTSSTFDESFSQFQNGPMRLLPQDNHLSNLTIGSNLNENTKNFSRSVSILSRRSPSSDASRSHLQTFKPIKNDQFDEQWSCGKSCSESSPDFWQKLKEDREFEEALHVDSFDPDDEYESMVEQTKQFDSLFFRHNTDDSTNMAPKAKIPLGKTHSVPSEFSVVDLDLKNYSNEHFNRQIKFGPIERPKSGLKESNIKDSNRIYQKSNNFSLLTNQENRENFGFNEFKLFGSEIKSDLESALESLVPLSNSQLNQNQAWNSVLLNEINQIPSTTTSNQDPVDLIKNIWSDQFKNDFGN